jgi:hypothetical protein
MNNDATIIDRIKDLFKDIGDIQKNKALETVEWEYQEFEHVFALLTIGFFSGQSSPPMHISLELLPLLEKELILMLEKVDTANSPLSELFSVLDVG